ncbi:hypothetical protein ACFQ0M_46605 [Kitasatospora aburaviensis]|uniref:Uncharacterized protein n=1 Tax=Kitasatospora aburaviensis TaxID=67265 RepID=A0ABW1FAI4_9ACTN
MAKSTIAAAALAGDDESDIFDPDNLVRTEDVEDEGFTINPAGH